MPFTSYTTKSVPVHSDALNKSLEIHTRISTTENGKDKPALLCIHGYPQTSHMWNRIADQLAERYTVVIPDLRGYGKSDKPKGSDNHVEYSKREMASDMVQVMTYLSHPTFNILSHDRGSRVAHRLILDNPGKVINAMILDIVPTKVMYDETDKEFATKYWHWFFLLQPNAESVIKASSDEFFKFHTGSKMDGIWTEEDITEYKDGWMGGDGSGIHASCEDYRAAASIDLEHDQTSLTSSNLMHLSSLRVFWGSKGLIQAKWPHAMEIWEKHCEKDVSVKGRCLEGGHYLAEERSEEILKEVIEMCG